MGRGTLFRAAERFFIPQEIGASEGAPRLRRDADSFPVILLSALELRRRHLGGQGHAREGIDKAKILFKLRDEFGVCLGRRLRRLFFLLSSVGTGTHDTELQPASVVAQQRVHHPL